MIRYFYGDLLKEKLGSKCILAITTNGYVRNDNKAVMGRGIAKGIKDISYPFDITKALGESLIKNGNIVSHIHTIDDTEIVSFPVKPESKLHEDNVTPVKHMMGRYPKGCLIPGWACKADLTIIKNSSLQLRKMIYDLDYKDPVYIPRPGCGSGELEWSDVRQIVEPVFKDMLNVYICDFKPSE